MKKRCVLLLLALVSVAGCVDTPDSVCREFRNANNEHIDALMMVTSEAQAKRMIIRVFHNMRERYQALDKKWDIMETNWGRGPGFDDMKAFLESDGLHLYRAEYWSNSQRCTLELARLRNLLNQEMEHAKELARANGQDPEEIRAEERFKSLHALVINKNLIDTLRTQLEKPRLEQLLVRFNGRIDASKEEGKALLKVYEEKYKRFNKTTPIKLVF